MQWSRGMVPSSADWTKRIMKLMKRKPPPMTCVVVCNPGIAFTRVLHGAKADFSCEISIYIYNKRGRYHVKMYAPRCKGAQIGRCEGARTLRLVTAVPGVAQRTLTREPAASNRSCSAAAKTALASMDCAMTGARGAECQQAAVGIRKGHFANLPRKMP